MLSTNPYLHFMGNTETAMKFYKSIFGGVFTIFQRFKDVPGAEKMSEKEQDKIIHISLDLGKGIVIMATDSLESMGQTATPGNNYHIHLQCESEAEVEKIFSGLSVNGIVEMPLNKTFWGAYFGICTDQFGI
ncbi:MAG: VOC family protein, partial [Bacteroidota bacterium]